MLHHPWTYHALAADTLEVRLNHITAADAKQGGKKKTYDVDSSDPFWAANAGRDFPEVAEEVDATTKKYKADSEDLTRRTGVDPSAQINGGAMMGDQATRELTAAMSLLPEMQERKRRLDIHTHVATSLLGEIKGRELHSFHKLEQAIIMRQPVDEAELKKLLLGEGKGKVEDRVRLLLVYFLCTETVDPKQLAAYEEAITTAGGRLEALKYLKNMKMINSMSASTGGQNQGAGGQGDAGWWMNKGLSLVSSAVKNLIPVGDQLAVTRLVESIMEQKSTPEVDAFAYLDPKGRMGGARVTSPFKEAIVFVVGGGNYTEYQNLQDCIVTELSGKTVIYGSTELCSAEAYLNQLHELGSAK